MPTYITFVNYTAEGMEHIKDSPERLAAAKEVTAQYGGEFKDFYLTFGQYDVVYIAEFSDDESAAQAVLTIGQGGAVATETVRAFTEDEYRDVIAGIA
jgi:uncharacterized protein with GYD domain